MNDFVNIFKLDFTNISYQMLNFLVYYRNLRDRQGLFSMCTVEHIWSVIKSLMVTPFAGWVSTLYAWLKSLAINPSFLSDVTAFNVAIFALWIPLTIEIITRISDRYKSEVIVTAFERKPINRYLVKILMLNLILAVGLRFSITGNTLTITEEMTSWVVMVLFLVSCGMLLKSISILKTFAYKTDYVLQELIDDVKKIFK